MILIDAGPLVALINVKDQDHQTCVSIASRLTSVNLITTWPCFAEAMYLLHRDGGYRYQEALWDFCDHEVLKVHHASEAELSRMRELMRRYADLPMDLADASLVTAAESLGIKRIFTIDSHFYAYRTSDGSALDIII